MSFAAPSETPHHFFAQIAGAWAGMNLTWLEPEGVPTQSAIQGSIQLLLDGRFALYLYQSSMDGEAQVGMFTFGFNTMLDRYEASWVDSFHNNTAIMFCTGAALENGFAVIGGYPDPTGGPDWSWRTELQLRGPDDLLIIAYNVSPEGLETRAIESRLTRIKK
jgi:hypothetical protein